MKKIWNWILPVLCSVCLLAGCQAKAPFERISITADTLQQMVNDKESFVLLVERDNCPFCEALNEYMDSTSASHPGVTVYVLDISSMDLKKPTTDARTLVSSTAAGKLFLEICPYFYYTPTMYHFINGQAVDAGVGINANTHEVSLWGVDSTADLDTARQVNVWTYIEGM